MKAYIEFDMSESSGNGILHDHDGFGDCCPFIDGYICRYVSGKRSNERHPDCPLKEKGRDDK
jgi:hypothetical protein